MSRRENFRGPRSAWSWGTMWLEERVLLSGTLDPSVMNGAVPIVIGSPASGNLTKGGADFYVIEPSADGRLIAQTHAGSSSLQFRLSIYDGQGNLLVVSDGQSAGRPDPLIDQHIAAGADFLEVQSISGTGTYSLETSLTPSSDPAQTLSLPPRFQEGNYAPLAVGDFNNDGIPDIVATDGVHLGIGDGTFQTPSPDGALVDPFQYQSPSAIAVGDFNGDHNLDAAVALAGTDSISISLGNGDGSFQAATAIPLPGGGTPSAIVAGDFGTGHLDLAVADVTLNMVYILQGNGDGTFQVASAIPVGQGPVSIAVGDFEQDDRTDLAVADINFGDVTILSNQGGGVFLTLQTIELPGSTPTSIVAGDFGTGHLDLAVMDSAFSVVDILQGNGDGTFRNASSTTSVGANPYAIVAGDFGNGHLDLADANATDVAVLVGNGDGTFQAATYTAAGSTPVAIVAGDFNGDGHLDMATGNAGSNDISVLLGNGDGSFQESVANSVGSSPSALATGDFTGNGKLGVAVVNLGSDSVTILPGNGDGTFQRPLPVPLPPRRGASSIVTADFNGDGRTDMAVADPFLNEVSILLGNGDGTFESLPPIPVAGNPHAIAAGDFTGNGQVDLAVADRDLSNGQRGVTILMNYGDGTFRVLPTIAFGEPFNSPLPTAIVAANFTGDGKIDLAVADQGTDDVTVFLNNGDGTFQPQAPISLGNASSAFIAYMSLVAGNFTHDGHTDLAVATTDYGNGDSVVVLLGNGDGTFAPVLINQSLPTISLGYFTVSPVSIVAGDFNGDGNRDLATADANGNQPRTDDYSVYLGNGDGTFQGPTAFTLAGTGSSTALVTGDFAGNGRTDLAISRTSPDDVQVRLSNGDGTFSDPSVVAIVRRADPLVADLNGDGVPDVAVVDAAGNILYRTGRPGEPGSFASPGEINPGDPSRDIAFVVTNQGPLLASVDVNDNAISFFTWHSTGFVMVSKLATGATPAQILSAELDSNGVSDLIVRNAGDGTISVFPGDGHGWFLPRIDLPVGLGVSDVEVAVLHPDGRLDIVFTDRLSGEVGVLENFGRGVFAPPVLYRAGLGPYGVTGTADPSPVSSREATAGVAAGAFTTGGPTDLMTINPGSETIDVLASLGGGRFANPVTLQTRSTAKVVRVADFNHDGIPDLAVRTADGVSIYLGNGKGGFAAPVSYGTNFDPSGLTIADINHDGNLDLIMGESFGDLLVSLGNGDGTFQGFRDAEQSVKQSIELVVGDLTGNGSKDIIYADRGQSRVVVDYGAGHSTVLGNVSSGIRAPGALKLADLNGDGILDLIVANSGSNNVLVYPGLVNGTFAPALNFFTGTNPAGITVADVNGDGRPDLIIANKGSNDVSILINVKVGNRFTFVPRPRLKVGNGPISTVVGDFSGHGVADLLVTDSYSNDVRLLPGIGNGFFNDQNPTVFPVGDNPGPLFVGNFDGKPDIVTVNAGKPDIVTVNAGSNDLTLISDFIGPDPVTSTITSGGLDPVTAFAFRSSSGSDNLVVGNNGDGALALFEGGPIGLTLTSSHTEPNLPSPTDLAFSVLTGGQVEFYAATAGREAATLVSLSLSGETLAQSQVESSLATVNNVAQLVPLSESSLALVGSLLTLTISTTGSELNLGSAQTEAAASVAFLAGASVSLGQSLSGPGGHDDAAGAEGEKAGDSADGAANPASSSASPWERFILGLDEALERFRRDFQGPILGPEDQATESAQPKAKPSPESSSLRGPTSLRTAPSPLPNNTGRELIQGPQPSRQAESVDASIDSIWREDVYPGLPVLSSPRTAIRLAGAGSGTEDFGRGPSRFPAIERRLRGRLRDLTDPGQDKPVELSLPLVVATLMTGWAIVARPSLGQSGLTAANTESVPRSRGVIDCCMRRRARARTSSGCERKSTT